MKTLYTVKGLRKVFDGLRSVGIFDYTDEKVVSKFFGILEVNDLPTFPERADNGKFVKIGDKAGNYKILMEE